MTTKRAKTATFPERSALPVRIPLVFLLGCLSASLIFSVPMHGRERPRPKDYALIFGTVWGPDGRPLPGVRVKIRRANEKKARWEVYSNRLGEFEQRVPVGKQEYIVWADTKGYKSPAGSRLQPGPEVSVQIESNERADTGLHLK